MSKERVSLGRYGEQLALEALEKAGYTRVQSNYRCPFGEIDLIARDGETLVFIEIKSRSGSNLAEAKEAVTPRKQKRIARVALHYMKSRGCMETRARFDVVAVGFGEGGPIVEVIKNAFETVG